METTVEGIPMRYSIKSLAIHQLAVLINQFNQMNDNNDFKALLMTPFGLLKCDIDFKDNTDHDDDNSEFIVPVDKSKNLYKVDLSHLIKIRSDLVKKMTKEDNIKIIDNGATLSLKNVEIFKDNLSESIGSIEQMLIFADQVTAFTLVPRNSN